MREEKALSVKERERGELWVRPFFLVVVVLGF